MDKIKILGTIFLCIVMFGDSGKTNFRGKQLQDESECTLG